MELVWQIDWMKCLKQADGLQDFVIECGWRATAQEDTAMAQAYGSVTFQVPETPGKNFTPFDRLTEAKVLSWVWSSGVDREATEAAVAAQLDNLVNPPTIMATLPWSAQ